MVYILILRCYYFLNGQSIKSLKILKKCIDKHLNILYNKNRSQPENDFLRSTLKSKQ